MKKIYLSLLCLLSLLFVLCSCGEDLNEGFAEGVGEYTVAADTDEATVTEPDGDEGEEYVEVSDVSEEVVSSEETTVESLTDIGADESVPSSFEIQFIDVGQGDSALVECDGHYMLIDGGDRDSSSRIYSILKSKGIEKLDIIVASHPHEDHVGGLSGALNYAEADLTLCSVTEFDTKAFSDFSRYASEKGGGITVPKIGDEYTLGSADIKILGVNGGEENNSSIILKIVYGKTSFLFVGDSEREAEQIVLNSGADLSATVLKVGHHGSDDATTYPFLREIMPKYAVISSGEGNPYGHPHDGALSRLRDADVKVFRTDMQGDIYCVSDGESVTFSVSKNADADTLVSPSEVVIPVMTEAVTEATTVVTTEETTVVTTAVTTAATTVATTVATTAATEPAPSGIDYILNKNTKKFHYPQCSSVKQMKESNKWYYTGTRESVISMGYSSCGKCHP